MLLPRDPELAGHHVGRPGECAVDITAADVLQRADIPPLVQERRVRSQGVLRRRHGFELGVVHLDEGQYLVELALVRRRHQSQGITHIARDVADADHHVPVVDDVADLVLRDVLRREDCDAVRVSLGLARVDRVDEGAGIVRAQRLGVDHSLKTDVVSEKPCAEGLFGRVRPVRTVGHPDARVRAGNHRVVPEHLPGRQDRILDLLVSGAATDVHADALGDVVTGGVGVLVEEGLARHDHARDAEPALHGSRLAERLDVHLLLALAESLCGDDLLVLEGRRLARAGLHELAARDDDARPARRVVAALLDRQHPDLVAQDGEQWLLVRYRVALAVHGDLHDGADPFDAY